MAAHKKVVLIVDDESDLREILAVELQEAGFEILEAENGRIAYDTLQQTHVDAVISDINMPEWDGFAFLKATRKLPNPPHIFFLSGYAESRHSEAAQLEICTIFTKPFDVENLIHSVTKRLT